jgi:hypothetical protein
MMFLPMAQRERGYNFFRPAGFAWGYRHNQSALVVEYLGCAPLAQNGIKLACRGS